MNYIQLEMQAIVMVYLKKNMVRVVGLEPTLPREPDFESGASTNSTTPAQRKYFW